MYTETEHKNSVTLLKQKNGGAWGKFWKSHVARGVFMSEPLRSLETDRHGPLLVNSWFIHRKSAKGRSEHLYLLYVKARCKAAHALSFHSPPSSMNESGAARTR